MALYDIFALHLNGETYVEPIKVKRTDREGSKKAAKGMEFIGRLKSTTPKAATMAAKTRLSSGIISLPSTGELSPSFAIFCDINGVLDDFSSWGKLLARPDEGQLTDLARLRVLVSADKLERLVKLAIKYNAIIVCTSEWRKRGINIYDLVRSVLGKDGTEEQQEFVHFNRSALFYHTSEATPYSRDYSDSRSDEIIEYVLENKITHCTVLEDSHKIPEVLNPIMVSEHNGIGDGHFERLESMLKEFSQTKG